ncbi:hypothetical protein BGZ61DRAFT_368902, partial [Ilyonectria robusta]|uniref:uncharacterized protein n=1 Tax=Ilyonectria robusta TaxID=1079257 RepID=UPI001E8DD575
GCSARGTSLVHCGFVPNAGSLVSEPEYPLKLDAVFVHGADYTRTDPDGAHGRLNVSSILQDKATGATICYEYTGIVNLAGPAGKVLSGSPDAATTLFGDSFTHVKFEVGDRLFKEIENKVYVGAGRFIVEKGKPLVVEYKVSEVSQGH